MENVVIVDLECLPAKVVESIPGNKSKVEFILDGETCVVSISNDRLQPAQVEKNYAGKFMRSLIESCKSRPEARKKIVRVLREEREYFKVLRSVPDLLNKEIRMERSHIIMEALKQELKKEKYILQIKPKRLFGISIS